MDRIECDQAEIQTPRRDGLAGGLKGFSYFAEIWLILADEDRPLILFGKPVFARRPWRGIRGGVERKLPLAKSHAGGSFPNRETGRLRSRQDRLPPLQKPGKPGIHALCRKRREAPRGPAAPGKVTGFVGASV